MRTLLIFALMALGLAGCTKPGTAVETITKIERVAVRAPCPDRKTYEALKAGRPTPLRSQPMPADPDVRVARTQAQLGRYEAAGGWADKAEAALDRCQKGEDLTGEP